MGGHHMVSSRTAIGLFIKMRESIAEIKAIAGEDGDAAQKLTKLTESIDITKTVMKTTAAIACFAANAFIELACSVPLAGAV